MYPVLRSVALQLHSAITGSYISGTHSIAFINCLNEQIAKDIARYRGASPACLLELFEISCLWKKASPCPSREAALPSTLHFYPNGALFLLRLLSLSLRITYPLTKSCASQKKAGNCLRSQHHGNIKAILNAFRCLSFSRPILKP